MTTRSLVPRYTFRALTARPGALGRLGAWSLVEALPTLLTGYATARAVDDGFLADRPGIGLSWLAAVAVAVAVGALAAGQTYRCLAALAEPFRDGLTRLVVTGSLSRAVTGDGRADPTTVSRLTHQVEIVRDTFAGLIMVVRGFVVSATAALVGLLSLDAVAAGLVAAPLVAGLVLFVAVLPAMVARQRDYVLADEQVAAGTTEVISGHRDVVACGAQPWAADEVGRRIDEQAVAERRLARMAATRSLVLAVGGALPLVVLLLATPWLVSSRGLTAGAVLGALVYVCAGLQPALHTLVQGVAGGGLRYLVTLDRILRESASDGADTPVGAAERDAPETVRGRLALGNGSDRAQEPPAVELCNVTFRYGPAAEPTIDGLSLRLTAGEHLAVVGPSGAGKSTFAALVAGLRTPDQGEIRLAGRPVDELDPATLATRRVVVPQEAYVFTGTVAENLRYLRADATDGELWQVAGALGLDPILRRLGGLYAVVEPQQLSAGERQLLCAARAYLSPAPLVILDEATSHLDPAGEARVEQAFAARPGTLIVIAHRISSAVRAKRILIIDGGPATVGRHEEQLAASATYRALVEHWAAGPLAAGPLAAGRIS